VIPVGFETALRALKHGQTIRRVGWNGKGMFLRVLVGIEQRVLDPMRSPGPGWMGRDTGDIDDAFLGIRRIAYPPHIAMWTATGEYVPWLASVTDLMAEDWEVIQ